MSLSAAFLVQRGYKILSYNYHSSTGGIETTHLEDLKASETVCL